MTNRIPLLLSPLREARRAYWQTRRRFRNRATRLRLLAISRSSTLSGLYYGVINRELTREALAVSAGQLRYLRDRDDDEGLNFYLLRRNVHRLEKGLIMRPRRPVFARDFIEETVLIYSRIVRAQVGGFDSETTWARDVLSEYFAAVDKTDVQVARAYAIYELTSENHLALPGGARQVPFARDLSSAPAVDLEALTTLAMRRRSVRWYEDRPVSRDLVDRALQVAVQAPSACNRQPFVYRFFDRPEEAREVAAIAMGTKGFADKLPSLAVIVGQLRAYPFERDRHAIYIDASLSAMSFMFALETLGLASCPINWPDHEPYETLMRKRLSLDDDERVIMLLAYGWPDTTGLVPRSTKRDLDQVRKYEL